MMSRRLLSVCNKVALVLLLLVYVASTSPYVSALSENQKKLFNKGIYYYDFQSCSIVEATAEENLEEPVADSSVQDLAKQMLENENITYWTNNGVNTKDIVKAMAEGKKAYTTAPDGQPKETDMNPNVLKFILEAARSGKVMVNALTDKDHSSNSNHYKGNAVDLDNGSGNTTVGVAKLNSIAQKYGGTKNNEGTHHHYDFKPAGEAPQSSTPSADDSSESKDDEKGESESSKRSDSIKYPGLSAEAMSGAIDKFIKDTKPNSQMRGAGAKLVASAKEVDINPFLVVSLAKKESGLADPADYNVKNANNAFGRTATADQPNFKAPKRTWYKWSSVTASVDFTAKENNKNGNSDITAYLREVYGDEIRNDDLPALMNRYAPPSENKTAEYIKNIREDMATMTKLTGEDIRPESKDAPVNCKCGGETTNVDTNLTGSDNTEKALNFFIDKGYSPEQAAGIIGNFIQESRMDPEIVEGGGKSKTVPPPTGPQGQPGYGIAQWTSPGRKQNLEKFAKDQNLEVNTLELQLNFVIEEMKSYSGLAEKIKALKSGNIVQESALLFHNIYEGSADTAAQIQERVQSGKDALQKYGSGGSGGGGSSADSTACTKAGDDEQGEVSGEYAFPVAKKLYQQNKGLFTGPHHDYPAVDIAMKTGTPVYAMTEGTIVKAPVGGACGTGVLIQNGSIEYVYCHGTDGGSISGAKQGDKVKPGKLIMHSGNTGQSTGPHLHIQIKTNGTLRCPQDLLTGIIEGKPTKETSLPERGCVG